MIQRTDWFIRGAILVWAAGVFAAVFTRSGSSMGDIELMEFGIAHGSIFFWERVMAASVLAAALSLLIYPMTGALLWMAGLTLLEAFAARQSGGFPFAENTPLAR